MMLLKSQQESVLLQLALSGTISCAIRFHDWQFLLNFSLEVNILI